eukprot:2178171-Pleurochrysis_carterae.AAC.1
MIATVASGALGANRRHGIQCASSLLAACHVSDIQATWYGPGHCSDGETAQHQHDYARKCNGLGHTWRHSCSRGEAAAGRRGRKESVGAVKATTISSTRRDGEM